MASLESKERERTGIDSLKIRYNQVFGYYIEITKANLLKVPADFVRKQTLVNAERFMTQELKELKNASRAPSRSSWPWRRICSPSCDSGLRARAHACKPWHSRSH